MKPLLLHKQGFVALLLIAFSFFISFISKAQEKDDDKPIDRYNYSLRFKAEEKTILTADEYNKIKAILDKYKTSIPEIQKQFKVQEEAGQKFSLTETHQTTLKNLSKQFFNELGKAGIDMQRMQGFNTDLT